MKYVAAAFPSRVRARRTSRCSSRRSPGWKVETVGDDIAWMKFGDDGRLYAINPEAGFFGVAPGTGVETNPNAMAALARDVIFTNVALTDDGDVWWEGHDERAARARDRLARQRLDARVRPPGRAPERALHRRRRAGAVDRRRVGGPGGRADRRVPVRRAPRDDRPARERGVRLGARRVPRRDDGLREDRGGPAGAVGQLRFDPFAMLPFCGYNMADYFGHWLEIGRTKGAASCRRSSTSTGSARSDDGKFLWPGFGENSRVLSWVFRRCDGEAEAVGDADRPRADGRARCTLEGLEIPAEHARRAAHGRPRAAARAARTGRGAPRPVRRSPSGRGARAVREPEGSSDVDLTRRTPGPL